MGWFTYSGIKNNLIAWILNNQIGKYLDGIDPENLESNIWQGNYSLSNVKFTQEALAYFDLPIRFRHGSIGRVKIEFSMFQQIFGSGCKPMRVEITDVLILASAVSDREADWLEMSRQLKSSALEDVPVSRKYSPAKSKHNTEALLRQAEITLTNVHLRLEHYKSGVGCSFGLLLNAFKLRFADQDWRLVDISDSVVQSGRSNQAAMLLDMGVYFQSRLDDSESLLLMEKSVLPDRLNQLSIEIRHRNVNNDALTDREFCLKPFSALIRLSSSISGSTFSLMELSLHAEDLNLKNNDRLHYNSGILKDEELHFQLSTAQIVCLAGFLNDLQRISMLYQLETRPTSGPPLAGFNAADWWRHAYRCVKASSKSPSISWHEIYQHRLNCTAYEKVYLRVLLGESGAREELLPLEKKIDLVNINICREKAKLQIMNLVDKFPNMGCVSADGQRIDIFSAEVANVKDATDGEEEFDMVDSVAEEADETPLCIQLRVVACQLILWQERKQTYASILRVERVHANWQFSEQSSRTAGGVGCGSIAIGSLNIKGLDEVMLLETMSGGTDFPLLELAISAPTLPCSLPSEEETICISEKVLQSLSVTLRRLHANYHYETCRVLKLMFEPIGSGEVLTKMGHLPQRRDLEERLANVDKQQAWWLRFRVKKLRMCLPRIIFSDSLRSSKSYSYPSSMLLIDLGRLVVMEKSTYSTINQLISEEIMLRYYYRQEFRLYDSGAYLIKGGAPALRRIIDKMNNADSAAAVTDLSPNVAGVISVEFKESLMRIPLLCFCSAACFRRPHLRGPGAPALFLQFEVAQPLKFSMTDKRAVLLATLWNSTCMPWMPDTSMEDHVDSEDLDLLMMTSAFNIVNEEYNSNFLKKFLGGRNLAAEAYRAKIETARAVARAVVRRQMPSTLGHLASSDKAIDSEEFSAQPFILYPSSVEEVVAPENALSLLVTASVQNVTAEMRWQRCHSNANVRQGCLALNLHLVEAQLAWCRRGASTCFKLFSARLIDDSQGHRNAVTGSPYELVRPAPDCATENQPLVSFSWRSIQLQDGALRLRFQSVATACRLCLSPLQLNADASYLRDLLGAARRLGMELTRTQLHSLHPHPYSKSSSISSAAETTSSSINLFDSQSRLLMELQMIDFTVSDRLEDFCHLHLTDIALSHAVDESGGVDLYFKLGSASLLAATAATQLNHVETTLWNPVILVLRDKDAATSSSEVLCEIQLKQPQNSSQTKVDLVRVTTARLRITLRQAFVRRLIEFCLPVLSSHQYQNLTHRGQKTLNTAYNRVIQESRVINADLNLQGPELFLPECNGLLLRCGTVNVVSDDMEKVGVQHLQRWSIKLSRLQLVRLCSQTDSKVREKELPVLHQVIVNVNLQRPLIKDTSDLSVPPFFVSVAASEIVFSVRPADVSAVQDALQLVNQCASYLNTGLEDNSQEASSNCKTVAVNGSGGSGLSAKIELRLEVLRLILLRNSAELSEELSLLEVRAKSIFFDLMHTPRSFCCKAHLHKLTIYDTRAERQEATRVLLGDLLSASETTSGSIDHMLSMCFNKTAAQKEVLLKMESTRIHVLTGCIFDALEEFREVWPSQSNEGHKLAQSTVSLMSRQTSAFSSQTIKYEVTVDLEVLLFAEPTNAQSSVTCLTGLGLWQHKENNASKSDRIQLSKVSAFLGSFQVANEKLFQVLSPCDLRLDSELNLDLLSYSCSMIVETGTIQFSFCQRFLHSVLRTMANLRIQENAKAKPPTVSDLLNEDYTNLWEPVVVDEQVLFQKLHCQTTPALSEDRAYARSSIDVSSNYVLKSSTYSLPPVDFILCYYMQFGDIYEPVMRSKINCKCTASILPVWAAAADISIQFTFYNPRVGLMEPFLEGGCGTNEVMLRCQVDRKVKNLPNLITGHEENGVDCTDTAATSNTLVNASTARLEEISSESREESKHPVRKSKRSLFLEQRRKSLKKVVELDERIDVEALERLIAKEVRERSPFYSSSSTEDDEIAVKDRVVAVKIGGEDVDGEVETCFGSHEPVCMSSSSSTAEEQFEQLARTELLDYSYHLKIVTDEPIGINLSPQAMTLFLEVARAMTTLVDSDKSNATKKYHQIEFESHLGPGVVLAIQPYEHNLDAHCTNCILSSDLPLLSNISLMDLFDEDSTDALSRHLIKKVKMGKKFAASPAEGYLLGANVPLLCASQNFAFLNNEKPDSHMQHIKQELDRLDQFQASFRFHLYKTVANVKFQRAGLRAVPLERSNAHPEVSQAQTLMLVDVSTPFERKVVRLLSSRSIHNHLPVDLYVLANVNQLKSSPEAQEEPKWKRVLSVKCNEVKSLPLLVASYCREIFVQPQGFDLCGTALRWEEGQQVLTCTSSTEVRSVRVCADTQQVAAARCNGGGSHKAITLHVSPLLTARNCLPYPLLIELIQDGGCLSSENVAAGQQIAVWSVKSLVEPRVYLRLQLDQYQGETWRCEVPLSDERSSTQLVSLWNEHHERRTRLWLHITCGSMGFSLDIYAGFWIYNHLKSGSGNSTEPVVDVKPYEKCSLLRNNCICAKMQAETRSDTLRAVAPSSQPALFSFPEGRKAKVQLRLQGGIWSSSVSFNTPGSSSLLELRDNRRRWHQILLGISFCNVSLNAGARSCLTRIVTLSPYIILSNESRWPLQVRSSSNSQDGQHLSSVDANQIVCLNSNETAPFHMLWGEATVGFQVRYAILQEDDDDNKTKSREWSLTVGLRGGMPQRTLLRMAGGRGLLVQLAGGQDSPRFVHLRDYCVGDAPCRLINFCEDIVIQTYQKCGGDMLGRPRVNLSYDQGVLLTWDAPLSERTLLWSAVGCTMLTGFPLPLHLNRVERRTLSIQRVKSLPIDRTVDTVMGNAGTAMHVLRTAAHAGLTRLESAVTSDVGEAATEDETDGQITDQMQVFVVSLMHGRERLIIFTQREKIANLLSQTFQSQSTDDGSAKLRLEINVVLHSAHVSFISARGDEIALLGIQASPVLWINGGRTLNVQEANKMEHDYLNFVADRCANKRSVNMADVFELFKKSKHLAVLHRVQAPGVWLRWAESVLSGHRVITLVLNRLQLDHQEAGARFRTVLCRRANCGNASSRRGPQQPFFCAQIINSPDGSSSSYVESFKVYVNDEFDVRLHPFFLRNMVQLWSDIEWNESDPIQHGFEISMAQTADHFVKNMVDHQPDRIHFAYVLISIQPVHLTLDASNLSEQSFKQESQRTSTSSEALAWFLDTVGSNINFSDVELDFSLFELSHERLSVSELTTQLRSQVINDVILRQGVYMLLGLRVLGNPYGAVRRMARGVRGFLVEPVEELGRGDVEGAISAFGSGAKTFLVNVVGAPLSSISGVTWGLGNNVARLAMDEEFIEQRQEALRRAELSGNSSASLLEGGKSLVLGVVLGLGGVVYQPIRGASHGGGLIGFLKGAGRGLLGVVTRPVAGVLDSASFFIDALRRLIELDDIELRLPLRAPRAPHPLLGVRPFSTSRAQAAQLLRRFEDGIFSNERLWGHLTLSNRETSNENEMPSLVLITEKSILILNDVVNRRVERHVPLVKVKRIDLSESTVLLCVGDVDELVTMLCANADEAEYLKLLIVAAMNRLLD